MDSYKEYEVLEPLLSSMTEDAINMFGNDPFDSTIEDFATDFAGRIGSDPDFDFTFSAEDETQHEGLCSELLDTAPHDFGHSRDEFIDTEVREPQFSTSDLGNIHVIDRSMPFRSRRRCGPFGQPSSLYRGSSRVWAR